MSHLSMPGYITTSKNHANATGIEIKGFFSAGLVYIVKFSDDFSATVNHGLLSIQTNGTPGGASPLGVAAGQHQPRAFAFPCSHAGAAAPSASCSPGAQIAVA